MQISMTITPEGMEDLVKELESLTIDELKERVIKAKSDLGYDNLPLGDAFKEKDDYIDFLIGYHAVENAIKREYPDQDLGASENEY